MTQGTDQLRHAFRPYTVDGLPASGEHEPEKAEIRAAVERLGIELGAAQAGLTTVSDLAARDAFYANAENQGKLVYVNDNNGDPEDPDNGVYEYVDGAARLASGFYQGVATVVQPLVDEAGAAAALAEASASGFRDSATLPNLVTLNEQTFTDTGRMAGSAIPSQVLLDGRRVGKMTVAAGAGGSFTMSFARNEFDGDIVSASLRVVEADAGPGTSNSAATNRFLLVQRDAGGVEISGTRQEVSLFGSSAVTAPVTFSFAGVAIHANCSTVQISVSINANGLTGASERNAYLDQLLVAAGPNAAFRPPLPRAATSGEVTAATRDDLFIPPSLFASGVTDVMQPGIATLTASIDMLVSALAFPLPAALEWDSASYPADILRLSDGSYAFPALEAMARGVVDPVAWTAPPIHVDPDAGSDSNTGASWSSPVLSLAKAVQIGKATGAPYRIRLKNGATYKRNLAFQPAVHSFDYDFVVEVEGDGSATISMHDNLTFVAGTGGDAGLYSATGSVANAGTVIDLANLDSDGVPLEFAKYSSKSDLLAAGAVNGWYYDSATTTLWLRRVDGQPVTNANTRVLIAGLINLEILDQNINFYIKGVTFMGGRTGNIHVATTGNSSFVTHKCRFLFPGSAPSYTVPAWRVRNFNGLAISLDDYAAGSTNDLWNIHQDAGSNKPHVIIWNPRGGKTGDQVHSTSNNSITFHEETRGIVGNPDVIAATNGSNLANVAGTRCIVFGGNIRFDEATSGSTKASVETTGDAQLWMVGATVDKIIARHTSKVFLRDVTNDGGEEVYDTATIEAF